MINQYLQLCLDNQNQQPTDYIAIYEENHTVAQNKVIQFGI